MRTKKMVFLTRFDFFLKSPNVGEALRKLVSFQKCFQQNSPNRLKTLSVFSKHFLFRQNTFQKCFESILLQNTFVFCHTPTNCYHICPYPTVILLFDALSLIIENSHVGPTPSPFCFHRRPQLLSATVNVVVAATTARCPHSRRHCRLVAVITVIVAAGVLSPPPPPDVAANVAVAVAVTVAAGLAPS